MERVQDSDPGLQKIALENMRYAGLGNALRVRNDFCLKFVSESEVAMNCLEFALINFFEKLHLLKVCGGRRVGWKLGIWLKNCIFPKIVKRWS